MKVKPAMPVHFASVQFLRFVAAIMVVLAHTTEAMSQRIPAFHDMAFWTPGTFGVDIFFVISGFVMSVSARPPAVGWKHNLANAVDFIKRRILRIVPLYWFYTLLKIISVLLLPAFALRTVLDPEHIAASFFFIPALDSHGVAHPVLPVGWTLNFEMMFYLIFAVAIALNLNRLLFCFMAFCLLYAAGQSSTDITAVSFYGSVIIFEFAIGMLVAQLYHYRLPLFGALALIVAGIVLISGHSESLGRLPHQGLGAGLLVLGGIQLERNALIKAVFEKLSVLGDISYSTYLSHSFLVPGCIALLAHSSLQQAWLAMAITLLTTIAGSFASYFWLEQPMTRALKALFFRTDKPPVSSAASPWTAMNTNNARYIYLACPWTHKGGGMFKVADYLIQSQSQQTFAGSARLIPLDTRGGSNALFSFWVLFTALLKLVGGRLNGRLAGVHVNMAERLSLFRKGALIATARLLGIPVVLHLHAAQLHHFYNDLPRPFQQLTRWFFAIATHCIVLGGAAQKFVTEELKVPPEKMEIVINGVPPPSVARRSHSGRPDVPRHVLFLGNLSERKGVSDLLHALATPGLSHNLNVSIAGSGDIAAYQALADKLGISGFVRFEGWADQAKAAQLIAGTDVLVLPSYDEGLPLVILEALSHGVAVLCTPVGEIPAVLADEVNALFVTPGDIPGIAAGLHRLLNDDVLRHRLERNGLAIYEAQFSMARFFNNIAAIHRRVFGIAAAPNHAMRLPDQEETLKATAGCRP